MPSRLRTVLPLLASLAAGCAAEKANGRPWVHKVELDGVRSLDKGDIKDHIALSEKSWIPLAPKYYLDTPTLQVDKERIEAYYQAHGFFSAKVTGIQVIPRDGGKSCDVKITVDEGPRSTVRSIELLGLDALDDHEIKHATDKLPLRTGAIFDHQQYLASKGIIESRLKEMGHAWAEVIGEALVDRRNHTVDVLLRLEPGPVATFTGNVDIEGDSSVDPAAVRERIPIERGQRYDTVAVDQTRGRIYQLGVYSSVKVDVVPHPGGPLGAADLVVHVTPGKKNELRVGFGLGIEPQLYNVHVPLRYTRHNWTGHLRTLQLHLEPGWAWVPNPVNASSNGPTMIAEAELTQPDALWRDLEWKTKIGYDLGVDYAFMYQGPRLTIGLDQALWRDRIHVRASYNYQLLTFFNTAPTFSSDPSKARRFFGYTNPYRLAYLLGEASLDLRDQQLSPHSGAYLLMQAEVGADWLGGGFSYERLEPDVRVYAPLGKRVVLAARAQYGRIYSQGDTTPITRRLYLGGADSHRGFGYNRLSPQVPSGSSLPPVPIGGTESFLGQAELRVDMVRLYDNWLGLAMFWDVGDVPDAAHSIDWGDLHHAVGAGLRYHTLIGTLRVDLGMRLNRLSATEADGRPNPDPGSRFAFHLSIGEAF